MWVSPPASNTALHTWVCIGSILEKNVELVNNYLLVVIADQIPFFLTAALGTLVGCFPAYSLVNRRFLPPDPG